uniref:C2H2-type domain-containing protein n=1 Tax=Graphocephala atropunctata TaxID=36148 RepID=A0A1B6KGA5_9HEMI
MSHKNHVQLECVGDLHTSPTSATTSIMKEESCLEMEEVSSVGTKSGNNTADEKLPQTNNHQIEKIEPIWTPMNSQIKNEVDSEQHERTSSTDIENSNNVGDEKLHIVNNVLIKEEEDLDDTAFPKGLDHIKEEQLSSEEDEDTQEENLDPIYPNLNLKTDTGCTFIDTNPGHEYHSEAVKVDPCPEDCSGTDQNLLCSVYIKEELPEEELNDDSQQTNSERQDDETFGQHFLFQCLEPNISEQQNGNKTTSTSTGGSRNPSTLETDSDQLYWHRNKRTVLHNYPGKWKRRKCVVCQFITTNPYKWQLHQDTCEHKKPKKPVSTMFCQFCPYQATTAESLRQHVIRRHNFGFEPINCPYCRFLSLSISEVEAHIARKHSDVKINFIGAKQRR